MPDTRLPVVLSIAGSDSSAGAGIQADIKTCAALGVYCATAITALTAQNTCAVERVEVVSAAMIDAQIRAVFGDLNVCAVKIGMLATAEVIHTVAATLREVCRVPVVLDTVMVATSGGRLLDAQAVQALRSELLPMATIVTPNLPEAAALLDTTQATSSAEMQTQAQALHAMGCNAVLLKGGHLEAEMIVDVFVDATHNTVIEMPKIPTQNTHGTGCTLSSAIAAYLCCGETLPDAVGYACDYVHNALVAGAQRSIGRGHSPVEHFYSAAHTLELST